MLDFGNSGLNGLGYVRGGYFIPALESKAVSVAADGELRLKAVVEREGEVLLLEDDKGAHHLPGLDLVAGQSDPVHLLKDHLEAQTGLSMEIGFLYSVYETAQDKRQHIVYRAFAGKGTPKDGRFAPISTLGEDGVFATSPEADVLRRFAEESAIGNFSIYVGGEKAGRIHPIARK